MKPTRMLAAIFLVLLSHARLSAQTRECGETSSITWARISMRRLCKLADDPVVKQATHATDALSLFAAVPDQILARLPDSTLVSFAELYAATLGQVPLEACAQAGSHGGAWSEQFLALAQGSDSIISERWADQLVAWVWTGIRKLPIQPSASPAEAITVIRKRVRTLSVSRQRLMGKIARNEPVSDRDRCDSFRAVFTVMSSGPTQESAGAIRALLKGLSPWVVAT